MAGTVAHHPHLKERVSARRRACEPARVPVKAWHHFSAVARAEIGFLPW